MRAYDLTVTGSLVVSGSTTLTGDITYDDLTATGNIVTTGTNKIISGSSTSTGSFGSLVLSAALPVSQGGIGATSLTDKAVLISQDSGVDAIGALALTGNGELIIGGSSGPAVEAAADVAGTGLDASAGDGTLAINVAAAQTTITSIYATDLAIGEDSETRLDFGEVNKIRWYAGNQLQMQLEDGLLKPASDSDVDLGTTSVYWKNAYIDSVTTTGNVSGSLTSTGSFGYLNVDGQAIVNGMANSNLVNVSSSFSTRVSNLKTDSGSFSTRVSNLKTDSGSFSTRVDNSEASGALMNQDLKTSASPTFVNVTATGTMTAQEFHTEFVSASIVYRSGSTKFGDSIDDIHSFSGSIHQSGSFNLNDGNLVVADNIIIGQGKKIQETDGNGYISFDSGYHITGSSAGDIVFDIDNNANETDSILRITANNQATELMRVVESGNVGIGTNAPVQTLEVAGSTIFGAHDGSDVVHINRYSAAYPWGVIYAGDSDRNVGVGLVFGTRNSSGVTSDNMVISGSTGYVGIGTTTPTRNLDVRGSVRVSVNTTTHETFTLTTQGVDEGKLIIMSGSDNAIVLNSGDNSWITGGNLGIGTNAPATKLDITQASFAADAALRINNPSHNEHWDLAISNNSGTLLELSNYHSGTTMVWNNGGDVGIGTNAPATKLHVSQSADDNGIRVSGFDDVAANYGEIFIDSSGYFNIDAGGDRGLELKGHAIDFWVNSGGTHIGRWTYDGKLGIGTNAPDELLHIYDSTSAANVQFKITSPTNGEGRLTFADTAANERGLIAYDHTIDGFRIWVTGTERMRISGSGAVGIGTTTPTAKVHTVADATNAWTALKAEGQVYFYTSTNDSSELRYAFNPGGSGDGGYQDIYKADATTIGLRLNAGGVSYFNGGNVGIGTATPISTLTVQGDISGSGKLHVGPNCPNQNGLAVVGNNQIGTFVSTHDDKVSIALGLPGDSQLFYLGSRASLAGTGTDHTIGLYADINGNGSVGLDFYTGGTATGNCRMAIAAGGNVGIGTITAAHKLDVRHNANTYSMRLDNNHGSDPYGIKIMYNEDNPNDGAHAMVYGEDSSGAVFAIYSNGTFNDLSDRRVKENIEDTQSQLGKINQLQIKDYTRINDVSESPHIGFISQEVQEVYPHLITESDDNRKSLLMYKIGLIAPLVKAVQELSIKVEALEAQISGSS